MAPRQSKPKLASWAGFDLSTTALALGVRSRSGEEAFVQTKMRGATKWNGQPAFDLDYTPKLILSLLKKLRKNGWEFTDTSLSFSVRQHDMVLLDKDQLPLIPALSWQSNAASREVEQLRSMGAEAVVGRVEERFILPKLMWALAQNSKLRKSAREVMTTGDWIGYMLTGKSRLSTSDAISNGLLVQQSKKIADGVLRKAKLDPAWFPPVIQSGRAVGRVTVKPMQGESRAWTNVKQILAGAQVVASLGDNHATGVGCGLEEDDFGTVVVSAGTSGTINRVSRSGVSLAGEAACFEYYSNRLLLMMLADCCKWYDRFISQYTPDYQDNLEGLNELISHANPHNLRRVFHVDGREVYPPDWQDLTSGEQAASTQLSIMLELLMLVRAMLDEVQDDRSAVSTFVLTGGLSQSRFFQIVFTAGAKLLTRNAKVLISARKGPMRYQTAAYGALINAMRPKDPKAALALCPTRSAARPDAEMNQHFQYLLKSFGL